MKWDDQQYLTWKYLEGMLPRLEGFKNIHHLDDGYE